MDLGNYERIFRGLMRRRELPERIIRTALLPFCMVLYLFKWIDWQVDERRKRARVEIPVISVGNIAIGGVGKTPLAQYIAEFLLNKGKIPLIVHRGYGGEGGEEPIIITGDEVYDEEILSDEVRLHRNSLPDCITGVGRRRERVISESLIFNPDVAILDDGLQYRRLKKDLEIVMLDGSNPTPLLFPAGYGRDITSAIDRSDAVVITRRGRCEEFERNQGKISERFDKPVFVMYYRPEEVVSFRDGSSSGVGDLTGVKVLLFSVVPSLYTIEEELEMCGANVLRLEFPDHHRYTRWDVDFIERMSHSYDIVLTTEKDVMGLIGQSYEFPLYVLKSGVEVEPEDEFINLISSVV